MSVNISQIPVSALHEQSNLYGYDNVMSQRCNRILELYGYSESFKQIFMPRWKRNYEYYHNIDKKILSRPEHASKIFVPRPYMVVETKLPKLAAGVVSKDPMFTVLPVSDDDLYKAKVSQELLTKQWRAQDNGLLEMTTWMKDSFIFGLSIGKSGWEFKQEVMTKRFINSPQLDEMSMQMVVREMAKQEWVTTIDRPYFKNIDIANFYWDPTAATIEDCKFMIHRYEMARHDLMQLQRLNVYQNVEKIPKGGMPVSSNTDEFANRQFSLRNFASGNVSNATTRIADPVYESVEILECWWIDGFRRMKTVIANRNTIIQDIPIPYWHQRWPFYQLKDTPLTGEFVGLGEIDPIAELCCELNDMRNQQNDNRNQFLKAFWVANRTANVDLVALENMPPGGILEVTGDPNAALTVLRPPQLDTMTFGGQQQIDSDIQMVSGANDIAIGMPTRSQIRTATGAQAMAQSTDIRFNLTSMLYLEQMRKIGRDFLALNQQFMTVPVTVRILGQDGTNMQEINATPYDIPQAFDLYVTMGSELQGDADMIRQQSLQLFSILSQVPGFQVTEYAKELLHKFNVKDPQRYFEGSAVVPTYQIMQQMGIKDNTVMSSFAEQQGGLMGGGTQSNPRIQAASPADILQYTSNPQVGAA